MWNWAVVYRYGCRDIYGMFQQPWWTLQATFATCVFELQLYSKAIPLSGKGEQWNKKLQTSITNYPSHWPSAESNMTWTTKVKNKKNLQRPIFFINCVASCTTLEVMGDKRVQADLTHHFILSSSTSHNSRTVTLPAISLHQLTDSLFHFIKKPHYQTHNKTQFTPRFLQIYWFNHTSTSILATKDLTIPHDVVILQALQNDHLHSYDGRGMLILQNTPTWFRDSGW